MAFWVKVAPSWALKFISNVPNNINSKYMKQELEDQKEIIKNVVSYLILRINIFIHLSITEQADGI